MNLYELMEKRESVRNYDFSKKVELEVVKRILNAGRLAPSAVNKQPWKFIVVSSEFMLNQIYTCYHRDWFKQAPHVLIVKGSKNDAWTRGYDGYNSLETDLTIAMDHMILAAEFEGVSTCWIEAFDINMLRKVLKLQEDECVYAMTPLGYSEDEYVRMGKKSRKSMDEIVEYL